MQATQQDCHAVLALLNERLGTTVTMKIKAIQAGRASRHAKRVTVPKWTLQRGECYAFYYVIHEFTHAIGYESHGTLFKRKEDELLSLFGISIDRAKIYPKRLYMNGECQYKRAKPVRNK